MSNSFFVTGTDTGVGKTLVTQILLQTYQQQGLTALALKPVASGAIQTAEGLRNEDALLHQQYSSIELDYEIINPFCYPSACSPHIAAKEVGQELNAKMIAHACQEGLQQPVDRILVEGAGGWYTPINATETMADLAKLLNLPVILVVAMKLGCLNHARLTYDAIIRDQLPVKGWIANCLEPEFLYLQENIDTLKNYLDCPFLGQLKYGKFSI